MSISIQKIQSVLDQLTGNLEFLNNHISDIRLLPDAMLPVQRKIRLLQSKIENLKSKSPQDDAYINRLYKQEEELQAELDAVTDIEEKLKTQMKLMYSFLKGTQFEKSVIEDYATQELMFMKYIHLLSVPESFTKGNVILNTFLREEPNDLIINFLNH